jgi:uncharacterized protein (DUF924 family)
MIEAEDVLSFWFEPRATSKEGADELGKRWFNGGKELDQELGKRFGQAIAAARRGELDVWEASPRGTLALVLLLDQFPRNVFRGSAEAFASDEQALALTRRAIASGVMDAFEVPEAMFFALPFSHAEEIQAQRTAVAMVERLVFVAGPLWEGFVVAGVDFARKHVDVIARFGRFPHRNEALGRVSTPAELEYLAYLKRVGQWL